MLNDAETELIQLQNDRFIRNWRRHHAPDVPYPSFEYLRPEFVSDYRLFLGFAREQNFPLIVPDQCEVSYFNRIDKCGVWSSANDIHKVFRVGRPTIQKLAGSPIESVRIATIHELTDKSGEFVGRLFVDIGSGIDAKGEHL